MTQVVLGRRETVLETRSPEDVSQVAAKILEFCGSSRHFAIFGTMGAGKTTLVKALCSHLGSVDMVKSPTFAIVNTYDSHVGDIYHFDFYRIQGLSEVFDLGFDEYLDSGNYCFMEWPELIEPLIPEEAVHIHITITGPEDRTIKIATH